MAHIRLDNVTLHYPTNQKSASEESDRAGDIKVAGRLVETGRGRVSVQAVEAVTLSLEDGDRLGIIGSNGSGKTSLLRLMAGIYSPTAGQVSVEGRVAAMFSIGLGMQGEASGLRNIYLSGLVSGATRKQIKAAIPEIVAFTELGDYINMPIRTYSQGMSMRLKFACATAFRPDIVLLDEWIGAGDADFQDKAQKRLSSLLEGAGIVVIASHNRQLIRRVSNKLLWLERGRVMAFGEPEAVLEKRAAAEKEAGRQRTAAAAVESDTVG